MDGDLNRIKDAADGAAYLAVLNKIIVDTLTPDFWSIALPNSMDSSSARNPELFAYHAAQNKLGAPVLFSHKKVSDLLDPALKTKRKPLERHHLFPRAWLEKQGITDLRQINQAANFALLEWPENSAISDEDPSEYVPMLRPRFPDEVWQAMHEMHALPVHWESMPYDVFLQKRRLLMAQIIRRGYESLT